MDKIDYDKLEILDGYVKQLSVITSTDHSLELDEALSEISGLYNDLMKEILAKYDLTFDDYYSDFFIDEDNIKQELFGWLGLPQFVIPDPPDIEKWLRSQVLYFRKVKSSLGL